MVYPSASEVRETLCFITGWKTLRNKYGLTLAEIYEIRERGAVTDATRQWADDLRARLGGLARV